MLGHPQGKLTRGGIFLLTSLLLPPYVRIVVVSKYHLEAKHYEKEIQSII